MLGVAQLKADTTEVHLDRKPLDLKEQQELVGGYVEYIHLDMPFTPGKWVMVVNEDGLLQDLPKNEKASFMADKSIVGDALLCVWEATDCEEIQ